MKMLRIRRQAMDTFCPPIDRKRILTLAYFTDEKNGYPVKEFINSLGPKMRAKVFKFFELLDLEEHCLVLRMPFSRHLDDDIFEPWTAQGNAF